MTPEFVAAEQASERFKATGSRADLDATISAWSRALAAPDFSTHSVHDRRYGLLAAGTAEFLRYKADRQREDATASIDHIERALAVEAVDRPSELAAIHLRLSMVLAERYNQTGDSADLIRAAEIRQFVIDDAPEADQARLNWTIGLARMLAGAAQTPGREGVALDLRIAALAGAFNELCLHGKFWCVERAEVCFHLACAQLYDWQHSPDTGRRALEKASAAAREAELIFRQLGHPAEAEASAELGRRITRHLAPDADPPVAGPGRG